MASVSAQIANTLGASGGHAWNEPTAMAGWCFDKNHSHAPGFGTHMSDGWKQIMQSVKDQVFHHLFSFFRTFSIWGLLSKRFFGR